MGRSFNLELSIAVKHRQRDKNTGMLYCTYCNKRVITASHYSDDIATLDHIVPHAQGGQNSPDNLIVACALCNSVRGDMPIVEWLAIWAKVRGESVDTIMAGINEILAQPIDSRLFSTLRRFRKHENNKTARLYYQDYFKVAYGNMPR